MQKNVEQSQLMELVTWLSDNGISFLTSFLKGRKFTNSKQSAYRAWFDGSYRQISDLASASFYIVNEKGTIIYQYAHSFSVADYGSTFAEIEAFNMLLDYLDKNDMKDVIIYGDCAHVMEYEGYDIIDIYGMRNNVRLQWVPRYLNFYADELCTKVYDTSTYENKENTHISSIFYTKQNISLVRNILQEELITRQLYMNDVVKNHPSVSLANQLISEYELLESEEERDTDGMYLFSFDGTDHFIKISIYQAVRLMDRQLVTIINKNLIITHHNSNDLMTFSNPLNLAKWDFNNNRSSYREDHMRNVKNQTVYLLLNKGLKCISITTKQAKQLMINGLAHIFAEDVLVSKISEEALASHDIAVTHKSLVF
jgi:hypothetical protein